MRLTRKTRLGDLLEAFPSARSVFNTNDIDLSDVDPEATLSMVARLNEVDIEELLAELREEVDFDDDDFTYGGPPSRGRRTFSSDDDGDGFDDGDDDYDDDDDGEVDDDFFDSPDDDDLDY